MKSVSLIALCVFVFNCFGSPLPITYDKGWRLYGRLAPEKSSPGYVLYFKSEGKLQLMLDVNSCYADWQINDAAARKLRIEELGCTEMCCDGPTALAFSEELPQATRYRIRGRRLYLFTPSGRLSFKAQS